MIYVECDADMELLRYLGVPRVKKKHAGDKTEVIKKVLKDPISLGIVDEDPDGTQPGNLKKFSVVSKEETIAVRRHGNGGRLISFVPYFEEWLIQRAKRQEIEPVALGLPDSGERLHERLIGDMRKLTPLLEALDVKNDKEFVAIRNWINEYSK